jgi:hypothetical protein
MLRISQKMKPKSDQEDSFEWEAAKKPTQDLPTGQFLSSAKFSNTQCLRQRKQKSEQLTMEELGHPQPQTPMEIDNTTATGYSNGTVKQKRTKAMDMRFYWVKDRVKKGQFNVYWGPGYQNLADYFTKHHSPAHHKRMRDIYIHAEKHPINRRGIRDSALRGCVNTSGKADAQIPHPPLGDDSSPRGR